MEPYICILETNGPIIWRLDKNPQSNKWDEDTLKFIGDHCGGFNETARKTLSRLGLVEASKRVKPNRTSFTPAEVWIASSSSSSIFVQIDPFFVVENHIGFLDGIHGNLLSINAIVDQHVPDQRGILSLFPGDVTHGPKDTDFAGKDDLPKIEFVCITAPTTLLKVTLHNPILSSDTPTPHPQSSTPTFPLQKNRAQPFPRPNLNQPKFLWPALGHLLTHRPILTHSKAHCPITNHTKGHLPIFDIESTTKHPIPYRPTQISSSTLLDPSTTITSSNPRSITIKDNHTLFVPGNKFSKNPPILEDINTGDYLSSPIPLTIAPPISPPSTPLMLPDLIVGQALMEVEHIPPPIHEDTLLGSLMLKTWRQLWRSESLFEIPPPLAF